SDLDSTILSIRRQLKGCVARLAGHYCPSQNCGCSSVGRAPPCQGGRREFEPRHPLRFSLVQTTPMPFEKFDDAEAIDYIRVRGIGQKGTNRQRANGAAIFSPALVRGHCYRTCPRE